MGEDITNSTLLEIEKLNTYGKILKDFQPMSFSNIRNPFCSMNRLIQDEL